MSLLQTTTVGLSALATLNYPGYRTIFQTVFVPRLTVATACPIGLSTELVALWQVFHALMLKIGIYDITSITTKLVLAFGAATGVRFIWENVNPSLEEYLTFSESIPGEHPLASAITKWLASENHSNASRHTRLQLGNTWWSKLSRRQEYETRRQTSSSACWFWFRRYPLYFQIIKGRGGSNSMLPRMNSTSEPRERVDEIRISCPWFFPENTISKFLEHVESSSAIEDNKTIVLTSDSLYKDRSMRECWQFRSRPSRPLSTIDIEENVMYDLLEDINLFVNPSRAQWYAERGMSYLRGYLFYGPPGTGKSSTAFALAGHLGTALYKTSLAEIRNETHLHMLFSQPEKGDILLLEDIDSAGIGREVSTDGAAERQNADDSKISLAGLLNAIDTIRKDGVILIMSANNPETVDPALIRDGRIDRRFEFGYVSPSVIVSIFKRIYRDGCASAREEQALADMANEFASKFPSEMSFTPAEVQGFLTLHKTPEEAVCGVESWIEEQAHVATF